MKLIFISSEQYPNGGAATNRHLACSTGLIELGHDVEFILLSKQQWEEKAICFNGIKFTCVKAQAPGGTSKINKIRYYFRTIRNAKTLLNETNQRKKISAVILLDTSVLVLLPFLKFCKKGGIKVFHERTEYPFVVGGKSILGKIDLNIYLNFVVKKFDGIYVISQALKKYFSALTRSNIAVVNMVVDPARFEKLPDKIFNEEIVITYCGTLDDNKDGIGILIESFALISNQFPAAMLQLVGSFEDHDAKQRAEFLVEKLQIKERVVFTGFVSRDKIPALLKSSDILVLARPNNKQAEGGFPTKLGEYLATGNPVVSTNVGEIRFFLKDKINAFIAEPDSAEKFAHKLREALLSNNRRQIGIEGQKLIYNEFNYLCQAKVIEKLIFDCIYID